MSEHKVGDLMAEREPIVGKVARILNSRELIINRGSSHGVWKGMHFNVLDPKAEDIRDPDTNEVLGSVDRPKVRVEIIQTKDRLSLARTYRKWRVNVGGSGLSGFSSYFAPPKWETRYETFRTDEATWEDLEEEKSFVKTGDPVVQIMSEEDSTGDADAED